VIKSCNLRNINKLKDVVKVIEFSEKIHFFYNRIMYGENKKVYDFEIREIITGRK